MKDELLIVDDEEGIRTMLQAAMNRLGYTVQTAASGEEALSILEKKSFKVIILDLMLPGINGIDVCRQIRRHHPITCIYALTGYSKIFELADCREAGFDDYFNKPVKLTVLSKAVYDGFARIHRWTRQHEV